MGHNGLPINMQRADPRRGLDFGAAPLKIDSRDGATHETLFGARVDLPPLLCGVRSIDGLSRPKALVSIPIIAHAIEGTTSSAYDRYTSLSIGRRWHFIDYHFGAPRLRSHPLSTGEEKAHASYNACLQKLRGQERHSAATVPL